MVDPYNHLVVKDMHVSVVLMVVCVSKWMPANARFMISHKQGSHIHQVHKRSIIGGHVIAGKSIQNLFNGARFIISNGLNSYFVKKGGAEKALEDFKSLKLDTKRRIVKGTEYMTSTIGQRYRVILSRDPVKQIYTITLGKPIRCQICSELRAGYDEIGEKIIIYED